MPDEEIKVADLCEASAIHAHELALDMLHAFTRRGLCRGCSLRNSLYTIMAATYAAAGEAEVADRLIMEAHQRARASFDDDKLAMHVGGSVH